MTEKNQERKRGRGPGHGPAMGRPVEKAKDFKGTLKRLLGYLKPRRVQLIFVIIFAVISTIFSIVTPKVLGLATTSLFEGYFAKAQGLGGIDFSYIFNILLIVGILYLISFAFSYLMRYIMAGVSQNTVRTLREDVSRKLSHLPLKFFDSKAHGDILSRVTNDIDTVSSTLEQSMTQMITAVITIIGVIVMMLSISPLLTLVVLITLPMSIFITRKVASTSQKYFKAQQKTLGQLNGHVEEMYTGHQVVKLFNYEKQSIEDFEKVNDELYNVSWKAQFISGIIMPLMTLVNNIGYVFVAVGGGIMVAQRGMAIGDVQAFIQYSKSFGQPIVQTASIANLIQSTVAAAERVFEVLDELEEESLEKGRELDQIHGDVNFNHVKFGYSDDNILMEDMDIHVKKGQTVAIVGPTGAGKTTLVNLLMRFYDIHEGSITVDGHDIVDFNRGYLRSQFGMVLQDTWLFNGTIKENIAYGREDATDQDVYKAARAAYADHFIRTLPDGYDTVLNEDASNISQGQKQLLTIARAILANPSILILDEATSSVDTRTEVYIQRAMNRLMEGKTSFVIAHRLSTIRDADIILVMNEGTIIEQGNHESLMNQNGFYADLYNSQFTTNTAV
ncbi:ABC transporter ATP-binding protein [Acidaminobacter sp. JC074]|uniref:ABC transporter ATP-binding protein n=1 Tax=Acidaminobacter sp. JC074 TaxID=2530199 RepID=UPI00216D8CE3|nr:ABC transporter ATP-binding protein [Acidaminobacter sp. JC074]MCH4887342.1 ABC transporter ATP-binding protein [Acidaminobacter sp. JC074]